MEEADKKEAINIEVRRQMPMSQAGFERLSSHSKVYFNKLVFKKVFNGYVNHDNIEDGVSLARWLFMNLGTGYFIGFTWKWSKTRTHKQYTRALFKVKIGLISENTFNYEYISTRGIARYGFWLGEY